MIHEPEFDFPEDFELLKDNYKDEYYCINKNNKILFQKKLDDYDQEQNDIPDEFTVKVFKLVKIKEIHQVDEQLGEIDIPVNKVFYYPYGSRLS